MKLRNFTYSGLTQVSYIKNKHGPGEGLQGHLFTVFQINSVEEYQYYDMSYEQEIKPN